MLDRPGAGFSRAAGGEGRPAPSYVPMMQVDCSPEQEQEQEQPPRTAYMVLGQDSSLEDAGTVRKATAMGSEARDGPPAEPPAEPCWRRPPVIVALVVALLLGTAAAAAGVYATPILRPAGRWGSAVGHLNSTGTPEVAGPPVAQDHPHVRGAGQEAPHSPGGALAAPAPGDGSAVSGGSPVSGGLPAGAEAGSLHKATAEAGADALPVQAAPEDEVALPAPVQPQGVIPCGTVEQNMDYWTRAPPVAKIHNVASAEACSKNCFETPACMAWTWGGPESEEWHIRDLCFLLKLDQFEQPKRQKRHGLVAGGLPCDQLKLRLASSLFCIALMQPQGYEGGLLAMQYKKKVSLFACDEYVVYSNEEIELAPGLTTHVVDSTLKCEMGGEFHTALNLDIFITVWRKVISEGRFLHHDWTIKVDPDCVFFPDLLRAVLPHHAEAKNGVYLNNCKYGLHGPVEVLSRNALQTWVAGLDQCKEYFDKLCSGFCGWGEDLYLDQCLEKVLEVRRDDEWGLLTEDHCPADPQHPPEWSAGLCDNGDAAFHPFKTEEGYIQCLAVAGGELPATE